jgi:hypothetical protein
MYASNLRQVYVDDARVTDALVDRYYDLTRRAGNRGALLRRSATNDAFPFDALRGVRAPVLLQWGGPRPAGCRRRRPRRSGRGCPGPSCACTPTPGTRRWRSSPGPPRPTRGGFLLGGPAASR